MKNFTKIFSIALLFIGVMLTPGQAEASHFKGGDIYFRCLGNGQYQLVFTCYYSCEATSSPPYDPSSFTFTLTNSCGSSTVPASITASDVYSSPINDTLPLYCPGIKTTCTYYDGGSGTIPPGTPDGTLFRNYITAPFTIPPGCTVTAEMDVSARNAAITNLATIGADLDIAATLTTPASGACQDNPEFAAYPVNVFCVNQNVNFSQGAIDLSGDSLVYSLINPRTTGGAPIAFQTGCTATNPFGAPNVYASTFSFDTHTGNVNFTPTQSGNFVFAVQVDAYHNGVLVSSTMRDIQLVVVNCATNPIYQSSPPPFLTNFFDTAHVSGGVIYDSTNVGVCPHSTLRFVLRATSADSFSYVKDSAAFSQILPRSTYTVSHTGGIHDTSTLIVTWVPLDADTGFHYLYLTVMDTNCPKPAKQIYPFTISVLNGITTGPNMVYCNGGQPVTIQAHGATHYQWTDSATGGAPIGVVGYSSDSAAIIVAPPVPNSTVGYVVHGDLIGGCKNYDTVMVRNVPKFNLAVTAADSSICKYTSTTVIATATPPSVGPYTYQWTPATLVQSPTSASTAITPIRHSGWYHVLVTAVGGCVIGDSVPVNIQGSAPRITITPSNNNVCPGDTVTLNGQGFAENVVECGLVDTLWDNSYLDLRTVGTENTSTIDGTPYNGYYPAARVQYLIRASEMNAAGLTSGTITDISFFVTQLSSGVAYDSLRVSIGCTSQDSLTSFVSGLQEVSYPTSLTPNVGWTPHPFGLHFFNWDGSSNIVIQICYTRNGNSTNSSDYIASSTTSFNGATIYDYAYSNTQPGCNLSSSFPIILNTRPNIRIGMSVPNVMTYQWSPATLVCDTCPQTAVIVNADSTYHLTVRNNTCVNDTSIRVTTNKNIGIHAVPDTTLCGLDTVQLDVKLSNAPPATCLQDYVVQSIPYAAISGIGTAVPASSFLDESGLPIPDDATAGPFNIPFTFPFYCQNYNRFYINSNGWISFVNPYPNTTGGLQYQAQTFPPTAAYKYPLHEICLIGGDYRVNNGNVSYFVTGTQPNRVLVIKFTNLPDYGTTGTTSGEIHLRETSGVVELMLQSSNTLGNHTTGIKDSTGIGKAAPGRNNTAYTVSTPEGWRFTPINGSTVALGNTVWSPNVSISNPNIQSPLAWPSSPQTYYVDEYLTINQFTNPTTCHVRDSVFIDVASFSHSVTASPVTICPGDTSRLTFTSGHTISSYHWTPASFVSDSTIGAPLARVYDTTKFFVTAVDVNGCRGVDSVTVNVLPTPRVHVNSSATICYTDSVQLSVSGTYNSYQWFALDNTQSSGRDTLGTGATQEAHPRGQYLVRVSAAGATCYYFSDTATIDSFPHPRLHVTSGGPDSFCTGGNVVLEADQGYSNYQWTPSGSAGVLPVTTGGLYSYTAQDANGCHLFSDTTAVVVSDPPAIIFGPYKNPICSNESDTISVTTNPPGYPVVWKQSGTQIAAGNTFIPAGPGTYDVIASVGCPTDSQIVLSGAASPTVQIDSASPINACGCTPIPVTASATPASANDTYTWTADGSQEATYSIDSTGTYTVVVKDDNNCTASASITATLTCPQITLSALRDTVYPTDTNRLSVTPAPNVVLNSYSWTPVSNVLSPTEANTAVTVQHQGIDTFYVTVTDNNGCTNTKFITFVVIEPGVYRMPTAFSPNGDGKNEYFYPVLNGPGSTARVTAFRIYNRWGQLVYDNPAWPGWNGSFGGNAQASDTYLYFVTVEMPDPNDPSKTKQTSAEGSFQLFR